MSRLDYRWHLRELMATRGIFSTSDLRPLLAERGIDLSTSQVYRLVVERPERLNLKTLVALMDILGCGMEQLIEPVATARPARQAKASGDGTAPAEGAAALGTLRPRRAWITRPQA
ncbi:XRE family transcriptional regulator [Saccharothrix sp. NRRL B-16348]|uniref:helix-turn-helix domain-containing protein n=1 Tax=Saccharothrix sp. NRRL B-16348 TaxID=1415542 RepID=UPI0006AED5B8|nr:helix-turn-helix transcriptional regulator [Saccharothrix sp. NRRL B-16348]KOX14564.1 XRE family transcriptional regulator [Saccharothrix sp. NRRL B-16348]